MADTNAAVAVYDNHSEAEHAVKELQKSGFDMKKLSIVGKDYHTEENVVGYYNWEVAWSTGGDSLVITVCPTWGE